jgi:hypothetical protein
MYMATDKRVLLFVHVEQSPGDSGDPLAIVAREPDKATWNYEILETGEKGRGLYAAPEYALQDVLGKLGLL